MISRRALPCVWAALVVFAVSCTEMPSPPSYESEGLYLDPNGVWRDTLAGLFRDPDGVWRGTDADSLPFLDMPPAFRDLWRTCANCHSGSGKAPSAAKARKALRIDTWRQALAHSPERLVLAAKAGGMPPAPYASVPNEVLARAQAFLAAWPDSQPAVRLRGYRFPEAEAFVRAYCADCHSAGGRNAEQRTAGLYLLLDDYEDWRKHQLIIRERLDTNHLVPMPPQDYVHDLDGAAAAALPAARARMIAWLDSLSPNNAAGSGKGDSVRAHLAFRDLAYDPVARLVNAYCADCHTAGGPNPRKLEAWSAVPFDFWARWRGYPDARKSFLRRLDSGAAAAARMQVMPPPSHPFQPTEAERDTLRDWLLRGAPNTKDGS